MVRVEVRITKNILPGMVPKLKRGMADQVGETTTEIKDGCVRRSRVDTAEMRDGWKANHPPGAYTGYVYNNVPHTIFNELGTRFMPAQPMLAPSIDEAAPRFVAGVERVIEGLV